MKHESYRNGSQQNRWAVVLAGGDGTRLRPFTRSITGDDRPKQFCPVIGGETLLDQTRRRVAQLVPIERTLLVVTRSHEQFYKPLTDRTASDLLVVQPENKGTAPAILYSLLRIASQSPEAIVAIFPSDHHFSDDQKFMTHVEEGFKTSQRKPEMVTLMGISPEAPEVEFGWIEPHIFNLPRGVAQVRRFWEKPSQGVARKLMERGCLWNSFVMVGRVEAFLQMTRRALPEVYGFFEALIPVLGTPDEFPNMRALYGWLRDINFSHEVLAMRPYDLGVIKVDGVGWSDLGQPSRVLATLSRMGLETQFARSAG